MDVRNSSSMNSSGEFSIDDILNKILSVRT